VEEERRTEGRATLVTSLVYKHFKYVADINILEGTVEWFRAGI
jgi:hypothetical protein